MRKTTLVLAALAGTALATPALAQDADRDTHFSGVYVGGSIGGAFTGDGHKDVNPVVFDLDRDGGYDDTVLLRGGPAIGTDAFAPGYCNGQASTNAPGNCMGDDDGIEYGARIGYDARMGNLVVGGLLEVSKPDSTDYASAFSTTPAGYHFSREIDYALSARARLGFTPNGGALFYGTGGVSYAKVNHAFSTTNTANSFTPTTDGDMIWGWQAGGGAEIMLGNSVSLGLEYLYSRYNDDKYYVAVGQGTIPPVNTNPFLANGGTNMRQDNRYDFHSIRATLNFQL